MSEIFVENKQIVVPGEQLAKGMDYLPGSAAYRSDEHIVANKVGLVAIDGRAIKLIPLTGKYVPKQGDVVIGKVFDVSMGYWRIEVSSPYSGMLSVKEATSDFIPKGEDLSDMLAIHEYVICKITNVTTQKLIDLSLRGPGLHKLPEGQIVSVNASKVPRIIGKQGSMVSMIKDATGCNILVGQNGLIWLSGSPQGEVIAVQTIHMIERFAHVSGLTDLIKKHLDSVCKGMDLPKAEELDTRSLELSSGRGMSRPRPDRGRPDRSRRPHGRPRAFNKNRKPMKFGEGDRS